MIMVNKVLKEGRPSDLANPGGRFGLWTREKIGRL
jgi:hypothetical protein